jgi:hypothetical protein
MTEAARATLRSEVWKIYESRFTSSLGIFSREGTQRPQRRFFLCSLRSLAATTVAVRKSSPSARTDAKAELNRRNQACEHPDRHRFSHRSLQTASACALPPWTRSTHKDQKISREADSRIEKLSRRDNWKWPGVSTPGPDPRSEIT